MKNKKSLIKYYENRLEKVKSFWNKGRTTLENERGAEYIKHAEESLKAVINGRRW